MPQNCSRVFEQHRNDDEVSPVTLVLQTGCQARLLTGLELNLETIQGQLEFLRLVLKLEGGGPVPTDLLRLVCRELSELGCVFRGQNVVHDFSEALRPEAVLEVPAINEYNYPDFELALQLEKGAR